MAIDILNPIEIINALFGNLYFFGAIIILGYLLIAAKYRFNLQLTIMGFVTIFLLTSIIQEGFATWINFVVVGITMLLSYVFWRWMATR